MQESVHIDIEVFVGVDIAKGDHYACAVSVTGDEVLARPVLDDETAIGRLIDDAEAHGAVALVIDTTSSAASLLMEAAAHRRVPVAYVTGLAMRRAADLYAGAAKTDPKDALVLADYARRNADRLTRNALSDELPTGWGSSTAETSTSPRTPPAPLTGSETPCWPSQRHLSEPQATNWPPTRGCATRWRAGARPQRSKQPAKPVCAPASPSARRAPLSGSPKRSGPRSPRRVSPSQPRPLGATPSATSPPTSTASMRAAHRSPPTSRPRSWSTPWEKS